MSAGRVGATFIRGALSKVRSASTSRSVAQQAAAPSRVRDVASEAETLLGRVRGQVGQEMVLQDEIADLMRLRAVRAQGGQNKARRRTFQQAGQAKQKAGRYEQMSAVAVDRSNRVYSQLDREKALLVELQKELASAKKGMWSHANGVPVRPQARIEQRIAETEAKIDRLARVSDRLDSAIPARASRAEELRGQAADLESRARQMPKRRAPSAAGLAQTDNEISARQALLQKLQAPTQAAATEAVQAVTTEAAKPRRGRKALLIAGGGLGGYFGVSTAFGAMEERSENAQAGDRLAGMIRGAADQRLEMLRAMAAMQRIQQGARQNLANLAMQQPHVFNEIMAGRQLAPGVVSIGGNRQEQMMRMAEVGSAMATGQFNGMGSPDALGLLNQYMQG